MDPYYNANAVFSIFSKNYMELKKGLPIRPSELGVLNIITGTRGPHTPVVLADMLGVSKPMITAHITSLQSKGYVVKEPSAQDKRACYILPTPKALELVEREKAGMDRKLERLADGLGQGNFYALVALAEKANELMEADREAESREEPSVEPIKEGIDHDQCFA